MIHYKAITRDRNHIFIEYGKDVRAVCKRIFKRAKGRGKREAAVKHPKAVLINNVRFIFTQNEWKKTKQPNPRISFWKQIPELYRLDRQEAKKKSPKLMKMTERHILMKLQGRQ